MKLVVLAAGLGTRMREQTGGAPKHLLDVAGTTLLGRVVELAEFLGLEPLVVTRPEFEEAFRGQGVDVVVEGPTPDMIITLSRARRHVQGTFAWMGGDMLFADPVPLKELLEGHFTTNSFCSFFYCRTDRFKAKLHFRPEPEVLVTRQGEHTLSIPNFLVQSHEAFAYMDEHLVGDPRANFLQRAIEEGKPVFFQEYRGRVFEIDTPADLEEARRYFGQCVSIC